MADVASRLETQPLSSSIRRRYNSRPAGALAMLALAALAMLISLDDFTASLSSYAPASPILADFHGRAFAATSTFAIAAFLFC